MSVNVIRPMPGDEKEASVIKSGDPMDCRGGRPSDFISFSKDTALGGTASGNLVAAGIPDLFLPYRYYIDYTAPYGHDLLDGDRDKRAGNADSTFKGREH